VPLRVDDDQSEHGPSLGPDADPDGADHHAIGEEQRRMVGRIVFVRTIGIIGETTRGSLVVIFVEMHRFRMSW
jgi:hypothetical protein